MENAAPRFNLSSIIAACIVAAALIASALIVAHRPLASAGSIVPVSTPSARPAVMPPIDQTSAQEQFRAQVMAAPAVHTFLHNGITYTLADIKVKQVIYTAKEDNFQITFDWVWQPAMPSDGPGSDYSSLSNDGYGHYYGSASPGTAGMPSNQSVDVNIK